MTMDWTGRRLDSIVGNSTTSSYLYDANGIRTRKTVGSTTTEYFTSGSTILAQKIGDTVLWFIYDSDGEILGFTYNGTPYYYIKNAQGDVMRIVDADGTNRATYSYDPWGKVLRAAGGIIAYANPIRYRSYYYDKETSLYYLQSRYYDPETGRFLNADGLVSTGQGVLGNNMFTYCGNNPVNRADPSGLLWQELADLLQTTAKIVSQVAAKAAESAAAAAAAAAKSATQVVAGGGVYRQLPNGLASALTAQSNTLSTISTSANAVSLVAGTTGAVLATVDVSIKVYNNFNNNNLSFSRKISDSVVDVGVTAGSVWAAGAIGASLGNVIPIPGVGAAIGFIAGVGIGLIIDYTPVVSWVKDGVGWVTDNVGGLLGSLFG